MPDNPVIGDCAEVMYWMASTVYLTTKATRACIQLEVQHWTEGVGILLRYHANKDKPAI